MSFTNQSTGSNSFQWVFGSIDNPVGTSQETKPCIYLFRKQAPTRSASGGTRFASSGYLYYFRDFITTSLQPLFAIDTLSCGDSLVLQLQDLSIDTLSTISSWQWTLNGALFSQEASPVLVIDAPGDYQIGLSVTAESGCQQATFSIVEDVLFISENLPADTLRICPGAGVYLNPAYQPQYGYSWSPEEGLSDPAFPNPFASPDTSTTYTLLLTDPEHGCTAHRQIHVAVNPPLTAAVTPDTTTCEPIITLSAMSSTATRYLWSSQPDFSEIVSIENTLTVHQPGIYLVSSSCLMMRVAPLDTVTVQNHAVEILLPFQDTIVCLGDTVTWQLASGDTTDMLSVQWSPDALLVTGQGTWQPWVQSGSPRRVCSGFRCLLPTSMGAA
ncbi:MAG: hypothetical protein R2795_23135 [Saprospiraceae bacterium]